MPGFLTFLSAAGTAAMIWVGGGIIVHGLEGYGLTRSVTPSTPPARPRPTRCRRSPELAEWVVTAMLSGIVGLLIGALAIPLSGFVIAPAWKLVKSMLPRRERAA